MSDRFLMEFKAVFLHKEIVVDVGASTWTGTLDRADEMGLWLTDGEDDTWLPWPFIAGVTSPPPEKKED